MYKRKFKNICKMVDKSRVVGGGIGAWPDYFDFISIR